MELIKYAIESLSQCCLPSDREEPTSQSSFYKSSVRIKDSKYRLVKLLGEGGFSLVYLCTDSSGSIFALKKIRCAFGQESMDLAMREISVLKLFDSPRLMSCVDYSIQQEHNNQIVYILLPYFRKGNLQDEINVHKLAGSTISESRARRLLYGVCEGLYYMHHFPESVVVRTCPGEGLNETYTEDESREPLIPGPRDHIKAGGHESTNRGPYAHYDLKPANIMIDDNDEPILMDFGSCKSARIEVANRAKALQIQDEAAEHSTMPYRAPELFDVQTDIVLTEKVDIWSLGCTLYAMLFLHSPFETPQTEQGSLALAICNGQYVMPSLSGYSEDLLTIIKICLQTKAEKRPSAIEILEILRNLETA